MVGRFLSAKAFEQFCWTVFLMSLILAGARAIWAQSGGADAGAISTGKPPGNASAAGLNLSVDSTLVLVPVTVTDNTNRFVLGLDKDSFSVLEDGKLQRVAQFSGEDAPLSVGLLVDISGSMGEKLEISRRAVRQFLNTMNAQDEAFLIEFSDRAELVVPFTHRTAEIEQQVKSIESRGLTALLDAVYLGLDEMKKGKNPRKALLIISDGGDNNSRYTSQEIKDLVKQADVQVYSMGVFEAFPFLGITAAELSGPRLLTEISQQTGGRVFAATNSDDLPRIAETIGVELRNQYVLAYMPGNEQRDGKYRHIEVKLKPPAGLPPLKARWRLGYYAPGQ